MYLNPNNQPKAYNATKWTEEEVINKLNTLRACNEQHRFIYIGRAMSAIGLYPDIWAYWKKKFANHEEITAEMAYIEYIFETTLVEATLLKNVNTTMAMFVLRCKYGYRDKPSQLQAQKPADPAPPAGPEDEAPETAPEAPADPGATSIVDLGEGRTIVTHGMPRIVTMYKKLAEVGPDSTTTMEELMAAR
jgi:hypothetical protein